jgi:undecaprenyl phosphate N,N'-diacetylbacillosamine 1-phosphate transferase
LQHLLVQAQVRPPQKCANFWEEVTRLRLFKYLPLYSQEQFRRHEVRPGITGWAQVNGRNSLAWSEKFRLDVEYVDRVSFSLDVQIAFLTLKKILVREGINQSATRPMEPFNGSN